MNFSTRRKKASFKSHHCINLKSESFSPTKNALGRRVRNSLFIFGVVNLLWFIFRSGPKPTRVLYPCQQAAINNFSLTLPPALSSISLSLFTNRRVAAGILIVLIIGMGTITPLASSSKEFQLEFSNKIASQQPSSTLFLANGRNAAHFNSLLTLMAQKNVSFYKSNSPSDFASVNGLFGAQDVTILKINCQWSERGGTNTDLLKEIFQALIDHPDGFSGEIIVADNGQGRGSMNWPLSNADDQFKSAQDVVDEFAEDYRISTYSWQNLNSKKVNEYSEGDMESGYVVYETPDPETGIYVSYPKFQTEYGTFVSFKQGIWNGTGYEPRLKVINIPVLKTHSGYGVTATLKHYVGLGSQGQANGHDCVGTGGMATLMVECGLPTLNIIDAIWINANPSPDTKVGPSTPNPAATRVNILMAGFDPVAMDYWAAKYILMPTAKLLGFDNPQTIDPNDPINHGLGESFGTWLNRSLAEFDRAGYNFTVDEARMNIITVTNQSSPIKSFDTEWWLVWGGSIGGGIIGVSILILLIRTAIKKKKKSIPNSQ